MSFFPLPPEAIPPTKNNDAPTAFPIGSLTAAVLFSIIGLVGIFGLLHYASDMMERIVRRDMRINHLTSRIIYYDEVLTISARLAANGAQDSKRWQTRYNEYEKKLDTTISETLTLAKALHYDVSPIDKTNGANRRLVALERQAFALIDAGKFSDAQDILLGREYIENKHIYSEGISSLAKSLQKRVDVTMAQNKRNFSTTQLVTLTAIMMLLLVWIHTLRNVKQWHVSTLEAYRQAHVSSIKLEESVAELEEKNNTLERFNYVVAHDLNESLRSMYAFSQMVEERISDKESRSYVQKIQNACNRMRLWVSDVMTYANTDITPAVCEKVNLGDVMDEICQGHLSEFIRSKGAVVRYDKLPTIQTDGMKIFQILSNLITNGLLYNESDQPEAIVSAKNRGDCTIITVEDNGIGIEEAYHKNIFGMFVRLNDKRIYQGSGLGLAICQKSVEHIGGSLWLENSAPGKGSVFAFSIPHTKPSVI